MLKPAKWPTLFTMNHVHHELYNEVTPSTYSSGLGNRASVSQILRLRLGLGLGLGNMVMVRVGFRVRVRL